MHAAQVALGRKLKQRNPFRIYNHLDQFFNFLFNSSIIASGTSFMLMIEKDKAYFESHDLLHAMK